MPDSIDDLFLFFLTVRVYFISQVIVFELRLYYGKRENGGVFSHNAEFS